MPDWSYRTLFRPLLFRLPAETARDITLAAMARLAALPLGPGAIEAFGHMCPPSSLQRTTWGMTFPSPVGLGVGLDVHATALAALARFGLGFLEVGPVSLLPVSSAGARVARRTAQQAIWYPQPPPNDGVEALARRLNRLAPLPVPLGIRLGCKPGASAGEAATERRQLIERLAPYAAFFTLETIGTVADGTWTSAAWAEHVVALTAELRAIRPACPLLVCVPPDLDRKTVDALLAPAIAAGCSGIVVAGGIAAPSGGRLVGAPSREETVRMVRFLHGRWGDRGTIVTSGGVHEPADALRLLDAGATFVQVDSGLVYSGPGLPKRINDAVAALRIRTPESSRNPGVTPATGPAHYGWAGMVLLGSGMVVGGILVWLVAANASAPAL